MVRAAGVEPASRVGGIKLGFISGASPLTGGFSGGPLCHGVTGVADTPLFGVSYSPLSFRVAEWVRRDAWLAWLRFTYPPQRLRIYRPNLRVRAAARGSVWS